LVHKMHVAKTTGADEVSVWGTGKVRREFRHSDDMADACVFLMNLPDAVYDTIIHSETQAPLINIGCGEDITVRELAELVQEIVGFEGRLTFDLTKPDGTPRKLLDVSRLKSLGWEAKTSLRDGIAAIYQAYLSTNTRSGAQPVEAALVFPG